MNRDLRFWIYNFRSLVILFLLFLNWQIASAQDTAQYKLKTGDLNIGLDSRFLSTLDSASNTTNSTTVEGLSLRYQSSIILHFFDKRPDRKFKAGDLLSAEIAAGFMQSQDPSQKLPAWFAYRFEMGAAFIYNANKNLQLNANLILLRFSRDFVTQNISGSGVELRIRYKRIIIETGLGSRQLRIIGFPIPFFNKEEEQNMTIFGFRYLVTQTQNAGARLEIINKNITKNGDGLLNLRFYYGRYF